MMLSCPTIYDHLIKGSPEQQEAILKNLDPKHEFWSSGHYLFQDRPYRYRLGFSDPPTYSDQSVAPGVFRKIMVIMIDTGALSEANMASLWTHFSQRCTREEWTRWYRPLVERRLRPPVPVGLFNRFAPEEFRIPQYDPVEFTPLDSKHPLPDGIPVVLEPILDAPRALFVIYPDRVETNQDDAQWAAERFQGLCGQKQVQYPLYIDAYLDGDLVVARDIAIGSQLDTGMSASARHRLEALEQIVAAHLDSQVLMIETSTTTSEYSCLSRWFGLFLEQGYSGMVIRRLSDRCQQPGIRVQPEKVMNLKATGVKDGVLEGIGTLGRKKLTVRVAHELTSGEIGSILETTPNFEGKSFQIKSCGLGPDGTLMFPVFVKWTKGKSQ